MVGIDVGSRLVDFVEVIFADAVAFDCCWSHCSIRSLAVCSVDVAW